MPSAQKRTLELDNCQASLMFFCTETWTRTLSKEETLRGTARNKGRIIDDRQEHERCSVFTRDNSTALYDTGYKKFHLKFGLFISFLNHQQVVLPTFINIHVTL